MVKAKPNKQKLKKKEKKTKKAGIKQTYIHNPRQITKTKTSNHQQQQL